MANADISVVSSHHNTVFPSTQICDVFSADIRSFFRSVSAKPADGAFFLALFSRQSVTQCQHHSVFLLEGYIIHHIGQMITPNFLAVPETINALIGNRRQNTIAAITDGADDFIGFVSSRSIQTVCIILAVFGIDIEKQHTPNGVHIGGIHITDSKRFVVVGHIGGNGVYPCGFFHPAFEQCTFGIIDLYFITAVFLFQQRKVSVLVQGKLTEIPFQLYVIQQTAFVIDPDILAAQIPHSHEGAFLYHRRRSHSKRIIPFLVTYTIVVLRTVFCAKQECLIEYGKRCGTARIQRNFRQHACRRIPFILRHTGFDEQTADFPAAISRIQIYQTAANAKHQHHSQTNFHLLCKMRFFWGLFFH